MKALLACGGRRWGERLWKDEPRPTWEAEWDAFWDLLDEVRKEHGIEVLLEGGARGADRCAREWAKKRKVPVRTFPADWDQHGKAAGSIRNGELCEALCTYADRLAVTAPGGRGTADMCRRLRAAHVPILHVGSKQLSLL